MQHIGTNVGSLFALLLFLSDADVHSFLPVYMYFNGKEEIYFEKLKLNYAIQVSGVLWHGAWPQHRT